MPDLLRIDANQRVDLGDFNALISSVGEHARHSRLNFFVNPNGQKTWITSGFAIDNPSAQQIRITRGTALLASKEDGQTRYGYLAAEGDATKTVDIASFTNGTYSIYIRFEFQEGDSESRIFWNSAGLGSEFAQVVPTRLKPNWSMRIESTNPGSEWFKIGEVVKSGGAPVITDHRDFYFEGKVDAGYANTWGVGSDRNPNRALFGIGDLQRFAAAMRKKLEEIQYSSYTGNRWWDAPLLPMDALAQTGDLSRDFVVSGLVISDAGGLNIGITAGTAYAAGRRVSGSAVASQSLPASQDVYVDLSFLGAYTFVNVAPGTSEPALTVNAVRIGKVSTGASTITSIVQGFRWGARGKAPAFSSEPLIEYNSSDSLGARATLFKSRGAPGQPVTVASGDELGAFRFIGFTGVSSPLGHEFARISAHVDTTPGVNDAPGRLSFWTTPDGTTNLTERLRLNNLGVLLVGSQTSFPEDSGSLIQVRGTSEWPVRLFFDTTTATARSHFLAQRSRSGGAVIVGDNLGGLAMGGKYDFTNWAAGWNGGAEITGVASENWGPSARGADLRFFGTRNGATASDLRLALLANGNSNFQHLNSAIHTFSSTATSGYTTTFAMDNTSSSWNVNSTTRSIQLFNNSVLRLTADVNNVTIGNVVWSSTAPTMTLNVPTFHLYDAYASLGSTLNNTKSLAQHRWGTGSVQYIREYAHRGLAGSDWQTASYYMHYQTDATMQAFLRFSGTAVSPYYSTHAGLGVSGSFGGEPTLAVDSADVYIQGAAKIIWANPNTTISTTFGNVKVDGFTGKLVGGDGTNFVKYGGTVFTNTSTTTASGVGTIYSVTIPANTLRSGSVIRVWASASQGSGSFNIAWRLNGVTITDRGGGVNFSAPVTGSIEGFAHATADPASSVTFIRSTMGGGNNASNVVYGGGGTIGGVNTTAAVTLTLEITQFTTGTVTIFAAGVQVFS